MPFVKVSSSQCLASGENSTFCKMQTFVLKSFVCYFLLHIFLPLISELGPYCAQEFSGKGKVRQSFARVSTRGFTQQVCIHVTQALTFNSRHTGTSEGLPWDPAVFIVCSQWSGFSFLWTPVSCKDSIPDSQRFLQLRPQFPFRESCLLYNIHLQGFAFQQWSLFNLIQ